LFFEQVSGHFQFSETEGANQKRLSASAWSFRFCHSEGIFCVVSCVALRIALCHSEGNFCVASCVALRTALCHADAQRDAKDSFGMTKRGTQRDAKVSFGMTKRGTQRDAKDSFGMTKRRTNNFFQKKVKK
jgi:hypothetical protein